MAQIKPLQIYNASAGSGKTYTLVQEYLRIVLNTKKPNYFTKIMAMTFTNKAANEMKSRIIESLISLKIPLHDKSEEQISFLKDTAKNLKIEEEKIIDRSDVVLNAILHNYGAFSIMTIDKFTHKVIRTFSRDLNLSVDFDVEMDVTSLRKNATDLLVNEIGRDKELTNLMIAYANSNLNDDKSWDFSGNVYDFSSEIFKEGSIKPIELITKLNTKDFSKIKKDLKDENLRFEARLTQMATEAIDLASSKGLTSDDFLGKGSSIIGYYIRVKNLNLKSGPSDTLLKNIGDNRLCKANHPNEGTINEIADLLIQYFNQIQDLLKEPYGQYLLNKEILKNIDNLSLLNHLVKIIDKIKKEDNTVLISDFYKKIADVIAKEPVPFIYERLGTKYEHYLLDEFQDTSHLQWVNMIPLVYDSVSYDNTNLIVGDGKQAIYRWRNGEVEQFVGLPEKVHNPEKIESLLDAERKFKQEGKLFPLVDNYRSAPEIIDFNNKLFTQLSSSLSPYTENIYKDVKQTAKKKHQGYVEVNFQEKLSADEQINYIHNTVKRSLAEGYKLSDICVLTRDNKKGAAAARFLTENGVKVISQDSLFIGKDLAVKFIFNLTCAIEFENNFNFKVKSLEHYASLLLHEEPRFIIDKLQEQIKTKSIIDIMNNEGYSIGNKNLYHNLYEFAESLISTFDLDISANPFLQFYLEKIHEFEKKNNSSIRDFISWFKEKGRNESIASPDGAEAVQIMTIHKSKGLQFPVVICPFVDWDMNLGRQIAWIQKEGSQLPAYFLKMTQAIEKTIHKDFFDIESSKFELDNINLLYVAFTRAENALFITGDSKKRNSISQNWLSTYFSNNADFTEKEGILSQGTFNYKSPSISLRKEVYSIDYLKQVMNKPKLSFKSAENWDIHNLDEKREFGTNVHKILSELKNIEDLEKTVKHLELKGVIDENSEFIPYIKDLFQADEFRAYFSADKTLNEKEIIDKRGNKFIPDKIIFNGDEIKVIDFKTGQQKNEHFEQVINYVNLMKDMGYENVKGEIYYTEQKQALKV